MPGEGRKAQNENVTLPSSPLPPDVEEQGDRQKDGGRFAEQGGGEQDVSGGEPPPRPGSLVYLQVTQEA